MRAYDLHIVPSPFDAGNPEHQGWIFGRPRGIEARHWPIDPNSGFPLMHGFTLRLPEDHRVHGPDIAVWSFFAVAPNHDDGAPVEGLNVGQLLGAHPDAAPDDPELAAIWHHASDEHPRLHRTQDILGCEYAVILLTEAEITGAPCEAPSWAHSAALVDVPLPSWLERGNGKGHAFDHVADVLGGSPKDDAAFERAIRSVPRANDPNAGVTAREFPSDDSPHTSPFDPDTYEPLEWATGDAEHHIGGTMWPIQGVPDFSPHYIGFEEDIGGYDFGSGNAWLDFLKMEIDWAC